MARVAITIEGGLFAADLLEKLGSRPDDVAGQRPTDFDLDGARLSEEIQATFSDVQRQWQTFEGRRARQQASATSLTRDLWMLPVLGFLGFDLSYQRSALQAGGATFTISHLAGDEEGAPPVHVVAHDQKLDERGDARQSPHALVQDYLNRADALWGVVTNGRQLRLLRDSKRFAKPTYIEFDLEAMVAGNLYSEFVALFRLAHRTRLPKGTADAHECWLERYYQQGLAEGGRVRERLSAGVDQALRTLGTGFLAHPDSARLLEAFQTRRIDEGEYYRQLLRLVYRLLFLMVAEERRLLLVPDHENAARQKIYTDWYSISRLRQLAERRFTGDRHSDLWEGLKQTFLLFRDDKHAAMLGLTALDGELFGPLACADLEQAACRNEELLRALFHLSTFEDAPEGRGRARRRGVRRRVNYAGLDVEELGSVYEGLLEYHPQVDRERWTFDLVAGSERKQTGSYYTPHALVMELIDSALVPVMEEQLTKAGTPDEKERALLDLKVVDPAAGSGHFLLAAARRIGKELARVRTGEPEPAPEAQRAAIRDVVRHCLYAVDRNPLAVDLCKVALWIEGHNTGRPLSFLDHHVKLGDSLIGVFDLKVLERGIPDDAYKPLTGDDKKVAAEAKKRNHQESKRPLLQYPAAEVLSSIADRSAALAELDEQTPDDVTAKEKRYRELRQEREWLRLRAACNIWTAAFFAKKTGSLAHLPTTQHVWDALSRDLGGQAAKPIADDLELEHRFFHWPIEFPEIAARGGFDVVLGNPPWDALSPDVKEFFATYDQTVRFLSPEKQEKLVKELLDRPEIRGRWEAHCNALYRSVHFMKQSHRYRLYAPGNLGKGDFNCYRQFVELALDGIREGGYATQVVPENFYNGANAAAIRRHVFDSFELKRLMGFENRKEVWFKDIDSRTKFAIYAARRGGVTKSVNADFGITSRERLDAARREPPLEIPLEIVREFSPDALAIMEFANQFEIEIASRMYAIFPKFGEEIEGVPYRQYMAEVHMGNDRHLFDGDPSGLPVYEGRMVSAFDYRAKGYLSGRGRKADWEDLPFGDPAKAIRPQWYIPTAKIPRKIGKRPFRYRAGFCDVASPTNERSLLSALIPPGTIAGDKVPTIVFGEEEDDYYYMATWLGIANSLVMDFIVRRKVALKMSYTIVDTLPFWRGNGRHDAVDKIAWRSLALSCAGPEMDGLWQRCRLLDWVPRDISPIEDPGARANCQAEIDALAAYLYGLKPKELRYVLDPRDVLGSECGIENFHRLRLNEEKAYKEYRTKRLVLEAYHRFARDGTFDPGRLEDPEYFPVVREALVISKGRERELERTLEQLVARTDQTALPTLFVEGATDKLIVEGAWRVLYPGEPLPFSVLAAGGTTQMRSLATPGKAMRELLGDRLVMALADNDAEGRGLWDEGNLHKGGVWKPQTNGVHWCLLKPSDEFTAVMERFQIPSGCWPFTIENAFPAALRRQALAEGAYAFADHKVQSDLTRDPDVAQKIVGIVRDLDQADDAYFYLMAPSPQAKDAFAAWVTDPARHTPANFAAFEMVLSRLKDLLARHAAPAGGPQPQRQTA